MKIYSCRVDDTHASSQKIIENLSRTLGVDDGGEDNDRRAARVGSKSASSRLNIVNTIASDVDSINASKIERVQATDPMFHKMSKAFDDGGAKGMLMNNLVSLHPAADQSSVFNWHQHLNLTYYQNEYSVSLPQNALCSSLRQIFRVLSYHQRLQTLIPLLLLHLLPLQRK